MTVHKLSHSYSALKMYDQCPLRYYRQRVIKDIVEVESEASKNGTRVHKHMEDRVTAKTPLPPELKKHEPMVAHFDRLPGELVAEKELVLTREMTPTTWWAEDAWLRSKLDVFYKHGDRAVILDWKTGKRYPDFWQLEISCLQTFIQYPEVEKIKTGFVWLKVNETDTEMYNRRDLPVIQSKLDQKIERIEDSLASGVWQAKPSYMCRFCPAQNTCQYADKRR